MTSDASSIEKERAPEGPETHAHGSSTSRSRWRGPLLLAAYYLILLELVSFAVLHWFVYPRDPSLLYRPDTIAREEYERYVRIRHPRLGWPTLEGENADAEMVRSRPMPSFPDTEEDECVSTYGDSFTYGDEVDDTAVWSNRLSELLDCRVANFGVSGYGSDQALLRARLNRQDAAAVTVLGIYPYNILRNVNRYRRYLAGPGARFLFKPRFVLDGDTLRLVESPDLSFEELSEELSDPGTHIDAETFLPGSSSGPPRMGFPYVATLTRLLISDTFVTRMLGRPAWTRFLAEDHPSHALEVTARIADAFNRLAASRSQRSIILIFPTPSSYDELVDEGVRVTEPLVETLRRRGLTVLDLHEPIRDVLAGESFCTLVTQPATCGGHFNPEGNRVVARIVHDFVVRGGHLPDSQ